MLKKAIPEDQSFTVTARPIRGRRTAPHLSYTHFCCVVQHEVRLLSNMYGPSANAFVNALAEAIRRYMGTTRMAGSVWEYWDSGTGRVIALTHEVVKGKMLQGRWFYYDNNVATRYMWFHSVRDLVCRGIKDDRINVVDLGPSRSDTFTKLKMKYRLESIVDWPTAAVYSSDFIYEEHQNEGETMGDEMIRMIEALTKRQVAREAELDDKD